MKSHYFSKVLTPSPLAEVLCTCMHMYELDWRLNLLADPKDVVLRQEKSWLAAIC